MWRTKGRRTPRSPATRDSDLSSIDGVIHVSKFYLVPALAHARPRALPSRLACSRPAFARALAGPLPGRLRGVFRRGGRGSGDLDRTGAGTATISISMARSMAMAGPSIPTTSTATAFPTGRTTARRSSIRAKRTRTRIRIGDQCDNCPQDANSGPGRRRYGHHRRRL